MVATAVITGTILDAHEGNVRDGGKTIIITIDEVFWELNIGEDDSDTQALIDGIDSAQSEGTGWDAVVKAGLVFSDVVRTSDTVVTITLPAFGSYDITADEVITITVPDVATLTAFPLAPIVLNILAFTISVITAVQSPAQNTHTRSEDILLETISVATASQSPAPSTATPSEQVLLETVSVATEVT